MINKLFVGGLSYNTTDQMLGEYFSSVGQVLSAKVIMDKYSGKSKGFGFVEMATEEEAKQAMEKLDKTTFDGRTIFVSEARPQEDRPNNRSFQNDRRHNGNGRDRDRRQNRY